MKNVIVCSLLLVILVAPTIAAAQFLPDYASGASALTVAFNPAYPAPGEVVTATLDDAAIGSAFSTITWIIDGKETPSVTNNRSFTFTAGTLGVPTVVTARLTIPGGTSLEATRSITPSYTDIIVEPQTYTPQTYAGRALPTVGSRVYATALSQGIAGPLTPESHSYFWKLNGTPIGGGAKLGAHQVVYTVPYGRNHTLSVEIFDSRGRLVARRGVNVQTTEVDLKFYEVSSLYGLGNTVVQNPMQFIGNTLTLRVAPYNLDLQSNTQNTFSEWRVNNTLVRSETSDPYELTLERTGQGQSEVGFKIRHREALQQGGEIRTLLNF